MLPAETGQLVEQTEAQTQDQRYSKRSQTQDPPLERVAGPRLGRLGALVGVALVAHAVALAVQHAHALAKDGVLELADLCVLVGEGSLICWLVSWLVGAGWLVGLWVWVGEGRRQLMREEGVRSTRP
jgi:hypothetical protein